MEKVCTKCNKSLPMTSEFFNKHPQCANGLNTKCKKCEAVYKKEHREKNKDRLKKEFAERYANNRDSLLPKRAEYRKTNKEKIKETDKKWKSENKELVKEINKNYYKKIKNNEEIMEKRRKYAKDYNKSKRKTLHSNRMKNDPHYRITLSLRKGMNRYLKRYKSDHTISLLGCSINEFKTHLESKFVDGMSWDNYGVYRINEPRKWHIDHILPCTSFDLTDPEQQKICFHYSNLQPLWGDLNIIKSNKIEQPLNNDCSTMF